MIEHSPAGGRNNSVVSRRSAALWAKQVEVRVSHISPKTGEIWGTLWSVAGKDPKKLQPLLMNIGE